MGKEDFYNKRKEGEQQNDNASVYNLKYAKEQLEFARESNDSKIIDYWEGKVKFHEDKINNFGKGVAESTIEDEKEEIESIGIESSEEDVRKFHGIAEPMAKEEILKEAPKEKKETTTIQDEIKEEKWRELETAEERIARHLKEREDISPEVEEILRSIEIGGTPAFISKKLERVAKENGIEITSNTTPNEIIEKLRKKKETPEEKVDLTTAEGRQKEIERISEEEIKSEKSEDQLLEAINKQYKKIDAEIKEKSPWIREKIEKAAEWYKKQPLWKKVVFSVGCIGAASASAALGGAVGAAVATAAFTGSFTQRLLGGIATFITIEGILQKDIEVNRGRERTEWEMKRHTLEAAALGLLVGSGSAAKAVREISEATGVTDILREAYRFWFPSGVQPPEVVSSKPGVEKIISQPEVPVKTQLSVEAPAEKIIEYQDGKSIWQEAGKQLDARFEEFADLGEGDNKAAEALKTYNIDRIKDTIADAIKSGDKDLIEKYGLIGIDNPDKITVEQLKSIKWSDVFEDTLKDKGLTENLSSEQVESIVENNTTLREFFKDYPNAPRTSENYEDILKGKGDTGIVQESAAKPKPEIELEPKTEQEATIEKPIQVQEIPNKDINQWIEKEFNVSPGKSNILNAEVFKSMHLRGIKVSDFIENKDKFLYGDGPVVTRPELNEVQQWDLKEKIKLIDKVEEILKKMNSAERLRVGKLTVSELILGKFIKNR